MQLRNFKAKSWAFEQISYFGQMNEQMINSARETSGRTNQQEKAGGMAKIIYNFVSLLNGN